MGCGQGAARTVLRRHARARRALACPVRGLDRRRERDLCHHLRSRGGCKHSGLCNPRADHAGRMVAHHRRLRCRLPVCGRGAMRQRRIVSVDARSACDGDRCDPYIAAGGGRQSGRDGGVGADRRGAARGRLAAVLRRSRCRPPGARSCDLAPLSESGRANPNPPDEPPPPPKGKRYAADFPANLFPWSREGEQ